MAQHITDPDPAKSNQAGLSYRDAGVDIDAGGELVERIKPYAKQTLRPGVLGSLGGFGALFELDLSKYRAPVLVAGTDGVGTKLKLALQMGKHDTIGIDLVAMCVNDLIVQGAEPLFFLDYYATGALSVDVATDVIKGIADGCLQSGAALIGGETAEMPGMYHAGDYDLAGFCVGVVDKDKLIDGSQVNVGDIVLGLASSGPRGSEPRDRSATCSTSISSTSFSLRWQMMGAPWCPRFSTPVLRVWSSTQRPRRRSSIGLPVARPGFSGGCVP